MRLEQLAATPHPSGNRIDLTWVHPDPVQFPGVRIVRREGTHPVSPTPASPRDGVVVADTNPPLPGQRPVEVRAGGHYSAMDTPLKGETVYYYALFPYVGDPRSYVIDRHNRTAAMATAPYDMAGQMGDLLPALYHRYDTVLPAPDATVASADRHKGQLRRFLDLPGSQLDLLYSFARALLDVHDLNKVDGRLLPLLAQWIGWQVDYRMEIDVHRNDIRSAPYLYKTIGLIPTVEATVKRLIGWESRTKEFMHNVFLSNRPERLNLWAREQNAAGVWSTPTAPLSLDFAYEGRPTAVRDQGGTLWLFYHTLRKGHWNIWYKTFREREGWTPSEPLTNRALIDKYPTAVRQGPTLRVFWSVYTEAARMWQINFRTRTNAQWSPITPLSTLAPFADPAAERRAPCAVVDNTDGVWLFWLERVGAGWQLQYNRHDGTTWGLTAAGIFPSDNGQDPRVESPPIVLFHPTATSQRLWVFWARKEPTGPARQPRWRIVYRVKASVNPTTADWGPIRSLPPGTVDSHDQEEPAAIITADGDVELFWSSNRSGSWAIWRATVNSVSHTWETAAQIPSSGYSQRDPLPVAATTGTILVYHSNESLRYTSTVYGATETIDARYAGSIAVDTRDLAKLALRGQFEDFQTYTHDTGRNGQRTNLDWYARDTVGIYLAPDSHDPSVITRNANLLSTALRQFLPAPVRTVFFATPQG